MSEAISMMSPIDSKCLVVTKSSSRRPHRISADSTTTMAKPEYMAPTTKYGGKIGSCQPGMRLAAKSRPTIECTEQTRGTASAAMVICSTRCACQWWAEPRQPSASAPKNICIGLVFARSRNVAASGIRPRYQNRIEYRRYERMAQKSQTNADRHCGQSVIVLG